MCIEKHDSSRCLSKKTIPLEVYKNTRFLSIFIEKGDSCGISVSKKYYPCQCASKITILVDIYRKRRFLWKCIKKYYPCQCASKNTILIDIYRKKKIRRQVYQKNTIPVNVHRKIWFLSISIEKGDSSGSVSKKYYPCQCASENKTLVDVYRKKRFFLKCTM